MLSDGSIAIVPVQIRTYRPAADGPWVEELWAAAMPPAWPVLRAGIAALTEGLAAESSAGPVGFVAVDRAGSIPLILVQPRMQRRGVGTQLLAEATDMLRASEVTRAHAGSGGSSYIWPGVPHDIPGAVAFFAARGWQHSHDVVDMIADLGTYQPPDLTGQRSAQLQISLTPASPADTDAVLAFENANFPSWVRWFQPTGEHILTARGANADIAGTLLFDGPGADTVFASMLGPAVGTIGCVGRRTAAARTRDRHSTSSARIAATQPGRHPRLPHRLDHPRTVLPQVRLPALATLRHAF